MRAQIFGGWDGAALDNALWLFQAEEQVAELQWDPDRLLDLHVDAPAATGSNYRVEVHHSAFGPQADPSPVLLPTRRAWRRITASGTAPSVRAQHATTVVGSALAGAGEAGALRHAMLVYGGRGVRRELGDLWELSLEAAPTPRAGEQRILCPVTQTGAVTLVMPFAAGDQRRTLDANATGAHVEDALQGMVDAAMGAGAVAVSVRAATPPADAPAAPFAPTRAPGLCSGAELAVRFVHSADVLPAGQDTAVPALACALAACTTVVSQPSLAPSHPRYRWTRVESAEGSGPPAVAEATLTAVPGPGGSAERVVLFGGWDGSTPRADVFLVVLGGKPGTAVWTQPAATAGTYFACTSDVLQSLTGGATCAPVTLPALPARYGHRAAPIAVTASLTTNSSSEGTGTTRHAVLVHGGTSRTRLPMGTSLLSPPRDTRFPCRSSVLPLYLSLLLVLSRCLSGTNTDLTREGLAWPGPDLFLLCVGGELDRGACSGPRVNGEVVAAVEAE